MKRAGIIGWPVKHSLSPVLHSYWLKEYGIDGEYLARPISPEHFGRVELDKLAGEGFSGVNVTVPLKEIAFKVASRHDAAANAAGAANLLIFNSDNSIDGRNTDTVGLTETLKGLSLAGKTVVLLGAGGAARAAVIALGAEGAGIIHILGRNRDRTNALKTFLQPAVKSKLIAGDFNDWPDAANSAALLINATNAGMTGQARLGLDLTPLARDAVVYDIVYNPLETELLRNAAARGHKTIDGLGMLMHQAVPSFEAFFGVRPSVTPGLRAALIQALNAP
jgi:shikimate dehydrogenase